MNVIDLFGGVGGFSLGAHLAGFSVPLAIDLDKTLTQSRPLNFPNGRVLHADITAVDPLAVLRGANLKPKDVCGIIGGPPCQGFSAIGMRKADDPRNQLVLEYFRFIKAISPAFFILENVPGILLEGSRTLLEQGMQNVEKQYTFVGPVVVDAAEFGAPTRRRRVLLIGYRSHVDAISEADIDAAKANRVTTVFQAIHDLPMPAEATLQEDGEYVATYQRSPDRGVQGAYARRARQAPPSGLGSAAVRMRAKMAHVTGFKATIHTTAVQLRFSALEQGRSDDVSRCPRLFLGCALPDFACRHRSRSRIVSVSSARAPRSSPGHNRPRGWKVARLSGLVSVSPHSVAQLPYDWQQRISGFGRGDSAFASSAHGVLAPGAA